ncbi:MAG TPA: glycosyl hydrolase family 28-related protein [Streptosporangiaceae bacterium]
MSAGPGVTRGRRRRRGSVAGISVLAGVLGLTAAGVAQASATTGQASIGTTAAAAVTPASSAAVTPAAHLAGTPDFGPNVYVFTPAMPQSQIQATVNSIATQQIPNQFGTQRYTLLFEPGTYGSAADPLSFQVGYYTQVAGLGSSPGDVTINGSINVYNQCFANPDGSSNCIALDNFWRSLSNLTVNITGQTGCESGADFWAVSQAAPMRRVNFTGGNVSLMDYCNGSPDYASGGYIADSSFTGGTVINGSQQQFFVRNTNLDGWSNGVWNQVFSGDPGAPAQSFSSTSGLAGGTNPYTTLATSPQTQEEPFLQTSSSGAYSVFVPALRQNSSGPSWTSGTTAGTSLPISKFFIATPGTPVLAIDLALALGKDLILTPGVYNLKAPIVVSRPDTVVMGLGFATLAPQNGTAAIDVLDPQGVKLSGMIVDAGPKNSGALVQLGTPLTSGLGRASDPALVQDVFFRIGGATAGTATNSLVVDASHVILDDIWAWRADHGAGQTGTPDQNGVGGGANGCWTCDEASTGLVVNGNDVLAYGLAVEHYQKNEVEWNGQGGEVIFFQNEMPYEPPSQAAWMSSPTTDGYPAFVIGSRVTSFTGYGMGSYSFFDQGADIHSATAFSVPDAPGVQLNDVFTRFLSGAGGIDHVVNDTGAPVTAANPGPSDVVSYP